MIYKHFRKNIIKENVSKAMQPYSHFDDTHLGFLVYQVILTLLQGTLNTNRTKEQCKKYDIMWFLKYCVFTKCLRFLGEAIFCVSTQNIKRTKNNSNVRNTIFFCRGFIQMLTLF